MNTNDVPPSYEDAIKSPPPTQADLAHHYTPPAPFAPRPATAPPVPCIPQPIQPYPTNGTPHTLPTYHYPPVVLQSNPQQPSNTNKAIRVCFFTIFTIVFITIVVFFFTFAIR